MKLKKADVSLRKLSEMARQSWRNMKNPKTPSAGTEGAASSGESHREPPSKTSFMGGLLTRGLKATITVFKVLPEWQSSLKRQLSKLARNHRRLLSVEPEHRKELRLNNYLNSKLEFNSEVVERICSHEPSFTGQIVGKLHLSPLKARLTYFGMVYHLVQKRGMWLPGKNDSPRQVSLSHFCKQFGLNENARKTLRGESCAGHYTKGYILNYTSDDVGIHSGKRTLCRSLEAVLF